MDSLFSITEATFAYPRSSVIFENITLTFDSGSFTTILGKNGAGKSTLLKSLVGRVRLQHGSVAFEGQNITQITPKALSKKVAYLEQFPTIITSTVTDYVLLGAIASFEKSRFWFTKKEKEYAHVLLKRLGITYLADKKITEISGGERQLAQICRSLMSKPSILILDEPVSALDIHHLYQVISVLKELNKEGMTIIATLHDYNIARLVSSKMYLLDNKNCFDITNISTAKEKLSHCFGITFTEINGNRNSLLLPEYLF